MAVNWVETVRRVGVKEVLIGALEPLAGYIPGADVSQVALWAGCSTS